MATNSLTQVLLNVWKKRHDEIQVLLSTTGEPVKPCRFLEFVKGGLTRLIQVHSEENPLDCRDNLRIEAVPNADHVSRNRFGRVEDPQLVSPVTRQRQVVVRVDGPTATFLLRTQNMVFSASSEKTYPSWSPGIEAAGSS